MKTITLIIDQEGNTRLEVHGMKGRRCTDATRDLERLLGRVHHRRLKREYHQQQQAEQQTLRKEDTP